MRDAHAGEARKVALAGMLLMIVAMGIGRFAYTPLLPGLREALGWSLAQAGDVASANYFGYVVGALVAATIAAAAPQRRWLVLGAIASALTTGAGVAVVSGYGWLLLRAGSGVASAFVLVLGTAIVTRRLLSLGRPGLIALHFAGVGIGILFTVLLVELARIGGLSVFGQWAMLGIACAACTIPALVLLLGDAGAAADTGMAPVGAKPGGATAATSTDAAAVATGSAVASAASVAETRAAVPVAIAPRWLLGRLITAYGLFGFGYVVTATFIVEMARGLPDARLAEPLAWLAVGLCAIPSTAFWQWVAARLGTWRALRIAFATEAVGVLLAGYGTGALALAVGGGLLGGTFVGITAIGLAAGRRIAPARVDRVIGWMTAAFGLGQWIGPAVAGRLAEASGGFGLPSLVAAGLLAIGVALLRAPEPAA
ncbi:MAG: YbfB/YjiJ family MFS transporter [Burkholderiaceae bacterium]